MSQFNIGIKIKNSNPMNHFEKEVDIIEFIITYTMNMEEENQDFVIWETLMEH